MRNELVPSTMKIVNPTESKIFVRKFNPILNVPSRKRTNYQELNPSSRTEKTMIPNTARIHHRPY